MRDFQIDGRGLVFEFQFHFAFEEKPIRHLPQKKRIERSIEEWIFPATRGESGCAIASEEKLCSARECFLHLQLERLHFLTQFLCGGFWRRSHDLFPFADGLPGCRGRRWGGGQLFNCLFQCFELLLHRLMFRLELVVLGA